MRTWIVVPQVNNGDEWVCIRGSRQELIVMVCIWLTVREQEKKKMTLFLNLHNWDGDDTIRRNREIRKIIR